MCLEPRSRKFNVPSSFDESHALPCSPDGCHVAAEGTVAPSEPPIWYSVPFWTLSVYDMCSPRSLVCCTLVGRAPHEQVLQLGGDLVHLPFGEPREEGQGDRARAHVLAHREL